MGILVVGLIILGLIAAIWGRDVAQGCISVAVACVVGAILFGIGYYNYETNPAFRTGIHATVWIIGLWLVWVAIGIGINAYTSTLQVLDRRKAAYDRWVRQQRVQVDLGQLDIALRMRDHDYCKRLGQSIYDGGGMALALPRLKLAISDADPDLRFCAIQFLSCDYDASRVGWEFEQQAVHLLNNVARDRRETPRNRVAALRAIGNGKYDGHWVEPPVTLAQGLVHEYLSDKNGDVRAEACHTLGQLLADPYVPDLIRALSDPYEPARREAAEALGRIKNIEALKALQRRAANRRESSAVRQAAQDAVLQLRAGANFQ